MNSIRRITTYRIKYLDEDDEQQTWVVSNEESDVTDEQLSATTMGQVKALLKLRYTIVQITRMDVETAIQELTDNYINRAKKEERTS